MTLAPHEYWQRLEPAGSHSLNPHDGFEHTFPAVLPDGRQLLLPIRQLPHDADHAVASLIINQASFAVEDALAEAITDLVRPYRPDVIIGVPTLGLPLASNVARRLGHQRMVALGTSRKFWYSEELSEAMSSITTQQGKRIYLDPRMQPVLTGRRAVVVDDVISSGTSIAAVLALLRTAGVTPVAVACAMLQSEHWRPVVAKAWNGSPDDVVGVLSSPFLARTPQGRWVPDPHACPGAK